MELPHNAFKHAIREGRQQIGLWSSLSSNYTVEVIAGAGHFCHLEKPDQVAKLVLDWIAK